MHTGDTPAAHARSDGATFRVHAVREATGAPERVVWCVSCDGREMGHFASAESALRAAMAYARTMLQKGEASAATVSRERADGPDFLTHLSPFR